MPCMEPLAQGCTMPDSAAGAPAQQQPAACFISCAESSCSAIAQSPSPTLALQLRCCTSRRRYHSQNGRVSLHRSTGGPLHIGSAVSPSLQQPSLPLSTGQSASSAVAQSPPQRWLCNLAVASAAVASTLNRAECPLHRSTQHWLCIPAVAPAGLGATLKTADCSLHHATEPSLLTQHCLCNSAVAPAGVATSLNRAKCLPNKGPLRAYTAACLTGLGCPPPPLSQACNQPLVQHILGCGVADHDEGRQAATPEALHINIGICSAATRQDIGCCSAGTCWCVTVEAFQGSRELCLQQHHCPSGRQPHAIHADLSRQHDAA